jgi:arylsulfatase A-like enzyme
VRKTIPTVTLITLIIAGFALFSCSQAEPEMPRPNILWILAEDMSPHFGVYGETVSTTPNVDKLAADGVKFENAFVTAPVCSPSRSAMVTGMYQTTIGAHQHRSSRGPAVINLPAGIKTIPEIFKENGYYVTNGYVPRPPNFDVYPKGKTDYNFVYPDDLYDGSEWSGRAEGQPFFAQIHLRGGKFRKPRNWFDPATAPELVDPADVKLPPYYPDEPLIREDWAQYLDGVNYVDQAVGFLLKRLADEGELDNTVVFFWTDHGISHARGKQFLTEEGAWVPLIVRGPGLTPGTVREDLVVHIDIAASSLDFAGIPIPAYMEARPLFGADSKPREYVALARDRCDETTERIRAIRTDRYKYIRNYHPHRPHLQVNAYKDSKAIYERLRELHAKGELNETVERILFSPTRSKDELYDLEADPWELNNLAGDSAHAAKLAELSDLLDTWIDESGDKGKTAESWEAYDGEMQVYLDGLRKRRPEQIPIIEANIAQMKKWAEEGK